MASLARMFGGGKGAAILFDYGFPAHEYYLDDRIGGTLMCHYRHHAHPDPFYLPGLQDITAHVDFTAMALAAQDAGLDVLAYMNQAAFLLGAGIGELLLRTDPADAMRYLPQANAVQKLVSPAEMGELFKVLVVGQGRRAARRRSRAPTAATACRILTSCATDTNTAMLPGTGRDARIELSCSNPWAAAHDDMAKIHTHYDNLKVARLAPQEVIRAAYKALTQKYHPDKNPGDEKAARIMAILNTAYGILGDPVRRKEHDEWIAAEEWEIEWLESTRGDDGHKARDAAPAHAWEPRPVDAPAPYRRARDPKWWFGAGRLLRRRLRGRACSSWSSRRCCRWRWRRS